MRGKPKGVALITRETGFALPIGDRLRYLGRDPAGIRRWVVMLDEHEWQAVLRGERSVHVDLLPPRSSLAIDCRARR